MNRSAESDLKCRVPRENAETAVCEWWQTSDGVEHFVRGWVTSTEGPVCLYLHGIEGHSRWIEETALALNSRGISLYALDRRGAGASKEFKGHIRDYKRMVQDVRELVAILRTRHPGRGLVLLGNCWGAKIALTVAAELEESGAVQALVLTSPAVSVKVDVKPIDKLLVGINYLFGTKKYFDIPLVPEHFTDNPVYLKYIEDDQLRLQHVTASFFVQSLMLTRSCKKASRKLTLPILVLQAGQDKIVRVEHVQQWFETVPSRDKTLKIFDCAAHSLDFDQDPSEYQNELGSWITNRVKPIAASENNPFNMQTSRSHQ